ncbi:hypothetical protein GCM10009828_073270 [Actinoplanes couchii]|uniref:Uncharacterized protein n=1 Tax=Actinoplanes couchii TaxID=403638 RepID=A0ABQ3X0G9_9ACTN|nr:hypothetical protein Aco03nite_003660 [Actinoplanes couchii]
MVLGARHVLLGGALSQRQHLQSLVRQAWVGGDHRMLRGLTVRPIEKHFDTILIYRGETGTRPGSS